MLYITFKVNRQNIVRTDTNRVVSDSRNYLRASFEFSEEWTGIKTAIFKSGDVVRNAILEGNECMVPWEVIKPGLMKVSVFCGDLITADSSTVPISESGYAEGGAPQDPTPTVYEQIIAMLNEIETGGIPDDKIAAAVQAYLEAHPVESITDEDVQRIVDEYVVAHKDELKGEKGDTGNTPNFTIGTVETLPSGSDATATITGDKQNPVLNLGIPKGADGQGGSGGSASAVDVLDGKKILFIGDSICEGVGANDKPYSYWIQQNHPSSNCVNMGYGGMTIAKKTDSNNTMWYRITNGEYENNVADADYIVIQGGINDIGNNVKLGYIRHGYDSDFKVIETCGGLEFALKYFQEHKKATAKVFLMTTYNVKNYNQYKQYAWYRAYSEIASKWGAEFIDCYSAIPTPILSGEWETQLHAPYPVHRDYIAPLIDDALCHGNCFGARTTFHYSIVPMEIYFYSGKTKFNVGEDFSSSDWRINSIDTSGTYGNITNSCKFDASSVDMSKEGTYRVYFHYNEKGISLGGYKDINVISSSEKVLDSISAIKTKTSYSVNDVLNLDDVTVTAHYSDSSTANVTANATISGANVDMNNEGTYYIDISYIENLITKTTQIAVSVTAEPQPEPSTWDDETTVTRAWGTTTNEGVFVNTNIAELTKDVSYNVNCELVCDHDGAIRLRIGGIVSSDYNCVANQPIQISYVINYTNPTVRNQNLQVYTTSGSDFPWTVKIKDFCISEVVS